MSGRTLKAQQRGRPPGGARILYINICTHTDIHTLYVCIYLSVYIHDMYTYIHIHIYRRRGRRRSYHHPPETLLPRPALQSAPACTCLRSARVSAPPRPTATPWPRAYTAYICTYAYIHLHTCTYTGLHESPRERALLRRLCHAPGLLRRGHACLCLSCGGPPRRRALARQPRDRGAYVHVCVCVCVCVYVCMYVYIHIHICTHHI